MHSKFLAVSLLLIGFVASAQPSQEGVVVDKIIAKIDDHIILKSDMEKSILQVLSRGQAVNEQAKCQILENLVVNKMMVARAEIDSVVVADTEVTSNLDRRMSTIIQSVGGSRKELEDTYGKSMEDIREELFDAIKEQMLIQRMQEELTANMEVSPAEVRKFFRKIPSDSLPYFSTEVKVAQIIKDPTPSEGQKEKTRQQMLDIRKRILSGSATFKSMARRYSEDGSASGGGDLPVYRRGEVDPAFEAAAMTLELETLSEPIESQFGYHLMEVLWRRGNTFKTRHILVTTKPSTEDFTKTEMFLDSIRTAILSDTIKFQNAAKEHSDDQQTSSNGGFFSDPQTGSLRVSVEGLSPDVFFAIDTMKIGNITKPIKFQKQDGSYSYRILYFEDKVPPHLANLDDDYQKIAAAALNSKQSEKLNKWFEGAKDGIFIEIDPEYDQCNLQQ